MWKILTNDKIGEKHHYYSTYTFIRILRVRLNICLKQSTLSGANLSTNTNQGDQTWESWQMIKLGKKHQLSLE